MTAPQSFPFRKELPPVAAFLLAAVLATGWREGPDRRQREEPVGEERRRGRERRAPAASARLDIAEPCE